jgi:DNA (cytosine-5)-methyltransferase 1
MSEAVKPKLLDLFCGAGGCSVGYARAGFEVVGVDHAPQPNYPFEFIRADALEFLERLPPGFDAIHASPPCQGFSSLKVMPNSRTHADLLTPVRALLERSGIPWVIENVAGAPIALGTAPLFTMDSAVVLCGTMFGLNDGSHELHRHRLFESSEALRQPRCRHRLPVIGFYGDHARTRQRTVAGNRHRGKDIVGNSRKLPLVRSLMGIDWMTWGEAVQAIPPAYTEYIGKQLIVGKGA